MGTMKELSELLSCELGDSYSDRIFGIRTLIRSHPGRVPEFLDELLFSKRTYNDQGTDEDIWYYYFSVADELFRCGNDSFDAAIVDFWRGKFDRPELAFSIGLDCIRYRENLFSGETEKLALEMLRNNRNFGGLSIRERPFSRIDHLHTYGPYDTINTFTASVPWLIERFGPVHLDLILQKCSESIFSTDELHAIIEAAVKRLEKDDLRKLLLTIIPTLNEETELPFLEILTELKDDRDTEFIHEKLYGKLSRFLIEPKILKNVLKSIGKFGPENFRERLWNFIEHKSKPVRELAGELLSRCESEEVFGLARKLLLGKKADERICGAIILGGLGESGLEELEKRYEIETAIDVRDTIASFIFPVRKSCNRSASHEDIRKRIELSKKGIFAFKCPWIDFESLPPLFMEGKKLDREAVSYLMFRQSRGNGCEPDHEASEMVQLIDRESSGDFALHLLDAFLKKSKKAEDRWGMILSCMLGDDRLVPLLSVQAAKWTDSARHKMGEYALSALRILDCDFAYYAIYSIMVRFHERRPYVSDYAKRILESFTQERKRDFYDMLLLSLVPELVSKNGVRKQFETKTKTHELRISERLEPVLYDISNGKTLSSIPSNASEEQKIEFSTIKGFLKETISLESARLEKFMLRNYRIPCEKWTESYLKHPLLSRLASELIWVWNDENGNSKSVFRPLEDGTLSDAEDGNVILNGGGFVSLARTLELEPEEIKAWKHHLSDYEIVQPFRQIYRKAFKPLPEEADDIYSLKPIETLVTDFGPFFENIDHAWKKSSVSGEEFLEFRRDERYYYLRYFEEENIVSFLFVRKVVSDEETEESTIEFEKLAFCRIEKRDENDYLAFPYPARSEFREDDPRVLRIKDVPPIVYSETVREIEELFRR